MFTIKEILDATKGRLFSGDIETEITGVSIDSRTIKTGDLFIAIKGSRFDGHNFINEALSRGAAAVIVQKGSGLRAQGWGQNLFTQSPEPRAQSDFISHLAHIIEVPDTIIALGDLACYHRKRFSIPIIGITGSCGKTTTKEMVAHILSTAQYNILKNEGTQNNQIGIPLTLLKLNADCEVAILEFGSNHPGEIKYLAEVASPTMGLITNIGPSHLEFFGDIEGVLHEKWSLIQLLPKDGLAVLNGDDPFLRCLPQSKTFGIENECDIMAVIISYSKCGLKFSVRLSPSLNTRYSTFDVVLNLLGRHSIYNALAAIGITSSFELDYQLIQTAFRSFIPVQMRLIPTQVNGFTILDDTYNCNPLSMQAALQTLADYPTNGKRILVVGDMLELGDKAHDYHRQIGRMASAFGIDIIVAVGKLCAAIEEAAKVYESQEEAAQYLLECVESGDTVLVKGSRAMKMEKIIDALSSALPAS